MTARTGQSGLAIRRTRPNYEVGAALRARARHKNENSGHRSPGCSDEPEQSGLFIPPAKAICEGRGPWQFQRKLSALFIPTWLPVSIVWLNSIEEPAARSSPKNGEIEREKSARGDDDAGERLENAAARDRVYRPGILPLPADRIKLTSRDQRLSEFAMCRSIRPLFNFEPPATDEEVRAAALQFVRKISGFAHPSRANEAAFASRGRGDRLERQSTHRLAAYEPAAARSRSRSRQGACTIFGAAGVNV